MNSAMNTDNYRKGLTAALACSVLWGILPLYWQSLRPIDSGVIIFYRVFLVGLVCLIGSIKMYGWKKIKEPWKDKKLIVKTAVAGLIITFNWSLYIWAINADHVIQTCIGYYIEPIVVCAFGFIIFKEKLERHTLIALIFATAGLIVILIHFHEVPFIALGLSFSFAIYAALKKTNTMPALISLFYETVFLMPFALAVIIYLEVDGKGALGVGEPYQYILMLFCGLLTAIPLALFGFGAKYVPLNILGLIEYISPSLTLLVGIFIFHEPFDRIQFLSFVIIWIGLVFFTKGELRNERK